MSREGRLKWLGMRETKTAVSNSGGQQRLYQAVPAAKHVWVTIGARKGDERVAAMVDPRRPGVLVGEDVDERRK